MVIQFSSAHHIKANEELKAPLIALLTEKLNRFSSQISRLEVHLAQENGNKEGLNDKRCLLEAYLDGLQPMVAKSNAHTYELAAVGAADKLKSTLHSTLGRTGDHHLRGSEGLY